MTQRGMPRFLLWDPRAQLMTNEEMRVAVDSAHALGMKVAAHTKQNLPLAIRSGVKIAYGTDLGEGDHAMEFGLLIHNGMSPMQAVWTATRNAADLLGAADTLGSLQPGRYADIVAVPGDPLHDAGQFEKVSFVMKGGVVYRVHGGATAALSE